MTDGRLIFGVAVDTEPLRPAARVAVVCLVDVRSDKLSLDADDLERHTYGGKVLSAALALEGTDLFDTLAQHVADATGEGLQLALPTPEPARYVEGTDMAMADVEIGGARHSVSLAELKAVDLTPARFYDAAHRLRSGEAIGTVYKDWTSKQRAFLRSFVNGKRPPQEDT